MKKQMILTESNKVERRKIHRDERGEYVRHAGMKARLVIFNCQGCEMKKISHYE